MKGKKSNKKEEYLIVLWFVEVLHPLSLLPRPRLMFMYAVVSYVLWSGGVLYVLTPRPARTVGVVQSQDPRHRLIA